MRAFRREPDGAVSARMSREERNVLVTLASQLVALLNTRGSDVSTDPALRRLLPDAYRDDSEAAAEFRRFTEESLTDRKVRNAQAIIDSMVAVEKAAEGATGKASDKVSLDAQAVQAWLRSLTDIRLTLATRLGIENDDDEGSDDEESLVVRDVYDWLGFVQGSLIEAIDR